MASFSAGTYLTIGKTMIHNLATPMSILMPLTLVSFMVILGLQWRQKKSASFVLTALGLFCMLLTVLITLAVEVPIDNQIKIWTTATLPPDWQAVRNHWEAYHMLRTMTALGAFGLALAATLVSQNRR